jgi:tRNA threonylcarbamoyladenosine modification (KEOPS) complex Cgi121 subunit
MRVLKVKSEEIENVGEFLKCVERLEEEEGTSILVLNEDAVFGEDQIKAATMHAERNFSSGRNVARDFKTEVMRYIACERQIRDAIEKAGIKKGTKSFVLVLLNSTDEDRILKVLGLKKSDFISEKRDKVDEALEGMALLDL